MENIWTLQAKKICSKLDMDMDIHNISFEVFLRLLSNLITFKIEMLNWSGLIQIGILVYYRHGKKI